jgi:hypothetical protein
VQLTCLQVYIKHMLACVAAAHASKKELNP